jgi:hypothetical protein
MDSRCSNLVAALALLIATGGFALFAATARAGERIEFSAPAIPLAKHKEDNAWDLNPLPGDEQDPLSMDDLFNARPEPNRLTNSSNVNMQRAWDGKSSDGLLRQRDEYGRETGQYESKNGAYASKDAQDNSRFDQKNGYDKDDAQQDRDQYGRETPKDKNGGFWSRPLSEDSSASDRFSTAKFMSYMDESATLSGGAYDTRMNTSVLAADSAGNAASFPDYESAFPFADAQSHVPGEEVDAAPGASPELRAWDVPSPDLSSTKFSSSPGQSSVTRGVVAPNRPVNLPMPRRPGDPY